MTYFGENTPKLGFGMMRLPRTHGQIDIEETKKMVDAFMDAGLTYFDTAYVYEGSEEATRKALVERYPRDSYTLASKINAKMMCHDEESCQAQLKVSLERTGAGYFDYYLLHALSDSNVALSKKQAENPHLNIEYRWEMNAVNASDREIWSKK